jgi:hypothetical protein
LITASRKLSFERSSLDHIHAHVLRVHMLDALVVIVDGPQHVAAREGEMARIEEQRDRRVPHEASSSGSVSTTAAMWW